MISSVKNTVQNTIQKGISLCTKSFLYVCGWQPLEEEVMNTMNESDYLVCVFSHTSYYDFFFMLMYYFSNYKTLNNLRTLIKPDYFSSIGWFLTRVGGIPATNIADKNGGATTRIVNALKSEPKGQLLISPKGTILKGEWRTGYYHIAQQLEAKLVAIGVDYEAKKITIGKVIDYQLPEVEIKHKLYKDLSQIVPLYPEREMMKIRGYDENHLNVIHPDRLIGLYFILCLPFAGYYLYKISSYSF